jgi:ABC-type glycerol-3-phosphate transport system permease component
MDGNGWWGTNRHIVFPLVRRELALIALLTVMATSLLLWAAFRTSSFSRDLPPWLYLVLPMEAEHGHGLAKRWLTLITGSLVMTVPVIFIFLLARRYLQPETSPLQ